MGVPPEKALREAFISTDAEFLTKAHVSPSPPQPAFQSGRSSLENVSRALPITVAEASCACSSVSSNS